MEINREELLLGLNLREIRRPSETPVVDVQVNHIDPPVCVNDSRSPEEASTASPIRVAENRTPASVGDTVVPISLEIVSPPSPCAEDVSLDDTVSDQRGGAEDSDTSEVDNDRVDASMGKRTKVRRYTCRSALGYEQSIESWIAASISLGQASSDLYADSEGRQSPSAGTDEILRVLLPRFVELPAKIPTASTRKCIGVSAPVSFWLWLSSKGGVGFVKVLNESFFFRCCSASLVDDPKLEEKIRDVCKEVTCLVWRASTGGIEAQDIIDEDSDTILEVTLDQIRTKNPLLSFLFAHLPLPALPLEPRSSPNESVRENGSFNSGKALQCMACGEYFENRLKLTHHQDRICYKRHLAEAGHGVVATTGRGGRARGKSGWLKDMMTTPGAPRLVTGGRGRGGGRGSRGGRGGRGRGRGDCRSVALTEPSYTDTFPILFPTTTATTTEPMPESQLKIDEDVEPKRRRGRPRIHPVKVRGGKRGRRPRNPVPSSPPPPPTLATASKDPEKMNERMESLDDTLSGDEDLENVPKTPERTTVGSPQNVTRTTENNKTNKVEWKVDETIGCARAALKANTPPKTVIIDQSGEQSGSKGPVILGPGSALPQLSPFQRHPGVPFPSFIGVANPGFPAGYFRGGVPIPSPVGIPPLYATAAAAAPTAAVHPNLPNFVRKPPFGYSAAAAAARTGPISMPPFLSGSFSSFATPHPSYAPPAGPAPPVIFKCTLCYLMLDNAAALTRHMELVHGRSSQEASGQGWEQTRNVAANPVPSQGDGIVKCQNCALMFNSSIELSRHIADEFC